MYAVAPTNGDIVKNVRDFQKAEREYERVRKQKRWREYVQAQCALIPKIESLTNVIVNSWDDLPIDVQDELLQVRKKFAERQAEFQRKRPTGFRMVIMLIKSIWFVLHEADLLRFVSAEMRFIAAIDIALANEARHRRVLDGAMESNPDVRQAFARGEQDYEAGRMTNFSEEEFFQRFHFT